MDDLPAGKTPYHHMLDLLPEATEAQRRARLGALGFGVEKADTKAENLSGGEKARLLFALATFHGPHLLILDEPTNHLDVDSREALVRALNDYEGAVILVSHDRHLMDASADRLWIVREGTVRSYDGDIESYRAECLAERGADTGALRGAQKTAGAARQTQQEARRLAAEQRAALAPLRKAIVRAEQEIDRLTKRIAAVDAALADGTLYTRDPGKAQLLARERAELIRAREDAEGQWLIASENYETAQARSREPAT
jgi:ATP-binding cassette subfamily F protein 3